MQSVLDGSALPSSLRLQRAQVPSIAEAFKQMCRTTAFDVCEMSITGYLLARVYGKPFTALPIFPARGFPQSHASIMVSRRAGIDSPRDLEGKRVGARAYTGTASLWVRGVLQEEYGVDLDKVTWVCAEEEHVLEYHRDAPTNVIYDLGSDLSARLATGDLDAGIGLAGVDPALIQPLIANARQTAVDYHRRTGIYQINHTLVVRDEVLAAHPTLARDLYEAFTNAKQAWLATNPDRTALADLALPNNDPFPYGLEANRPSIDALLRFAHAQHITPRRLSIEEAFPLSFG